MSNKAISRRTRCTSVREARAEHVLRYVEIQDTSSPMSMVYFDLQRMEMSRQDIDTAVDDLAREGRLELRANFAGVSLRPVPGE